MKAIVPPVTGLLLYVMLPDTFAGVAEVLQPTASRRIGTTSSVQHVLAMVGPRRSEYTGRGTGKTNAVKEKLPTGDRLRGKFDYCPTGVARSNQRLPVTTKREAVLWINRLAPGRHGDS